mmetsp:Transcript_85540/g.228823  ORF Transcript_85540/g.228823 Transcript_85540/m.228823 type:complete len:210 (-) Transcript_85540:471-1100(-)
MSFLLQGAPDSFLARAAALVQGLDDQPTVDVPKASLRGTHSAVDEADPDPTVDVETDSLLVRAVAPDVDREDDVDFRDFDEDKCRAAPMLRSRRLRVQAERVLSAARSRQDWTHYSLTNVACSDSQSNQSACFSLLRELRSRRIPAASCDSDSKPVFRKRCSAGGEEPKAKKITLHNNVRCMPECEVGTRRSARRRKVRMAHSTDTDEE